MKLHFSVHSGDSNHSLSVDIKNFIIAGWAGRDLASIEHHIEELAELGVPRPSAVPLFYRVSENQLTQAPEIQVLGPDSSGEVEILLFSSGGETYVSLTSDHTDRKLEAHSVAFSKQVCAKPVATTAWRFSDVARHWDELIVRSTIQENGREVTYQEGTLAALRPPTELIAAYLGNKAHTLPEGMAMSCGTVGAIGGIRPATSFTMELLDPHSQRRLRHHYTVATLPVVA